MGDNLAHHLRLMLVTDDAMLGGRDLIAVCRAAVRGGVTCIELRRKGARPRDLLDSARELRGSIAVPVIVNDRPDVAIAAGYWVHLGPEDLAVELARRVMPPDAMIGASVGTAEEAEAAVAADYWGIGPLRATGTKVDAGQALGLEGFARLVAQSGGRPSVAIGGVRPEDVGPVLRAGGVGVAVVSGILIHDDVETAARRYAQAAGW